MNSKNNNLIDKLNILLEAKLDSILADMPDHQELVSNRLKANKELFNKKINQLQTEYCKEDAHTLVQKKMFDLENRFAKHFHKQKLHNYRDKQQILDFILSRCPDELKTGYFLKEDSAGRILKVNPPQSLMEFLGVQTVDYLFKKMSALRAITISRYTEVPKWQKRYKELLAQCTADDFEAREVSYVILDYQKYKDIIKNSCQPSKPWRLSHNKVTGDIICFTVDGPEVFKTPFLQYLFVFVHYFFETAYAGKYYSLVAEQSPDRLGQAVLDSFTNHDDKFEFFGPNVYSETIYWEEAIKLLAKEFNFPELDFFVGTVYCGEFHESDKGKNLVSLNIVDHIWDANLPHGPFLYHFQEAFWKDIFQKIMNLSDGELKKEILENLHMKDLDFTEHIIKKHSK